MLCKFDPTRTTRIIIIVKRGTRRRQPSLAKNRRGRRRRSCLVAAANGLTGCRTLHVSCSSRRRWRGRRRESWLSFLLKVHDAILDHSEKEMNPSERQNYQKREYRHDHRSEARKNQVDDCCRLFSLAVAVAAVIGGLFVIYSTTDHQLRIFLSTAVHSPLIDG